MYHPVDESQIDGYVRGNYLKSAGTLAFVTNLHIVHGKHTLCIARKRRKDAVHDVHYCPARPFSMMCYVQTPPLYLVRNGSVIVIRTRPCAVVRTGVNHPTRIRDVPGRSLSCHIVERFIERFAELLLRDARLAKAAGTIAFKAVGESNAIVFRQTTVNIERGEINNVSSSI